MRVSGFCRSGTTRCGILLCIILNVVFSYTIGIRNTQADAKRILHSNKKIVLKKVLKKIKDKKAFHQSQYKAQTLVKPIDYREFGYYIYCAEKEVEYFIQENDQCQHDKS